MKSCRGNWFETKTAKQIKRDSLFGCELFERSEEAKYSDFLSIMVVCRFFTERVFTASLFWFLFLTKKRNVKASISLFVTLVLMLNFIKFNIM